MRKIAFLLLIVLLCGFSNAQKLKRLKVKTLSIVLLCGFSNAQKFGIIVAKNGGGSPPEDFTDITFWWTCESTTLGANDYSAGDTTATRNDGATLDASAKYHGTNGILINDDWENVEFAVSSDDIVSSSKGRCAQWVYFTSLSSGAGHIFNINYGSPYFKIGSYYSAGDGEYRWWFAWEDGVNSVSDISSTSYQVATSTWYYLEAEWDSTADYIKIYVNGNLVINNSDTIQAFSESGLFYGHTDGNSNYCYIDDCAVSDLSNARNFYTDTSSGTPLKDLTASPR